MSAAAMADCVLVRARRLLVLDLDDGRHRRQIDPEQIAALELVRAAGHHVVLQSEMALVGLLPLARRGLLGRP